MTEIKQDLPSDPPKPVEAKPSERSDNSTPEQKERTNRPSYRKDPSTLDGQLHWD